MQKTHNTSGDPSVSYIISVFFVIILSFLVAVISYEPLASIDFDFVFFENISINRVFGPWSYIVKFISSIVFSSFAGIFYHISVRKWNFPFIVSLPLAFLLSMMCFGGVVIALGFVIAILASILLILAMFFGPGDR